jgi:hypothetical protein
MALQWCFKKTTFFFFFFVAELRGSRLWRLSYRNVSKLRKQLFFVVLLFDRIVGEASFALLGLQLIDGIVVAHYENLFFFRFFFFWQNCGGVVCGGL